MREAAPTLSLAQIITFLHVADEDESVPMIDLQRRTATSAVQAWRNVQALTTLGLVRVGRWKMGSITAVELSSAGQDLAARLDATIHGSSPIAAPASVAT